MIDETTDCSNSEQVVICCRWIDSSLEAHKDFIKQAPTQASALLQVIKDFLLRSNLSISKLRGQCYDGAASMCGSRNGVATQILKEETRALYTHCYGHSLNQACSETIKQNKIIRNSLDSALEITKLVKKSPRRESILQELKQKLSLQFPGIQVLCPTRWTVCADTLQSIVMNYEVLTLLWEESLEIFKETEMRSRISGIAACMQSFDFSLVSC